MNFPKRILLALALVVCGNSKPNDDFFSNISVQWLVKPLSVEKISTDIREEGGFVLLSRLDPAEPFEIEGDVFDKNGKLIANRGDILVGLFQSKPTACQISSKNPVHCFVDRDVDGKFDEMRRVYSRRPPTLVLVGTKDIVKIDGIPYKKIDENRCCNTRHPLIIKYVYTNRNGFLRKNDFNAVIASQYGDAILAPTKIVYDGQFPAFDRVYGSRIRISSTSQPNIMHVEVDPLRNVEKLQISTYNYGY